MNASQTASSPGVSEFQEVKRPAYAPNCLQGVCVAVLLVTAGRAGLPGSGADSDSSHSARTVQSNVVDAMSDVDTSRTEIRMNISANAQALTTRQRGGQPIYGVNIQNATDTMDVANETDLVRTVELP